MKMQQQSLNGLRILNTRPLEQSQALSAAIRAAGGISIELPLLTIKPTSYDWLTQLPDLNQVHQAIFISPNAVHFFFTALSHAAIKWPIHIQVSSIGQATATALSQWSVMVNHTPLVADSEHFLKLPNLQSIKNQIILLIKGEQGLNTIETTLHARHASVLPFNVYCRVLPNKNEQYINSLWQDDAVDIILLTSEQAMHNLFALFGQQAQAWICSKPCLVISQRLAKAASLFGIHTIAISPYDELLNTLKGLAHDNSK